MAKLALSGQFYSARSLAAAAQTCINLYPERIEDPAETAKTRAVLFGTPGRELFVDLTNISPVLSPLRGLWTGGGRLFAFGGTGYVEINSAGAAVSPVRTIPSFFGAPVQAFVNGNQLLIVPSFSQVYIDNGAGPLPISIGPSAGVVDTVLNGVAWVSGDKFPVGGWAGYPIVINGVTYTVSVVLTDEALKLTTSAGIQLGVAYSQVGEPLTGVTGAYLKSYFLVNRLAGGTPDTGRQSNYSAVLDGTDWNGVDCFQKNGYPDYIASIMASGDQLVAFGTETLQFFTVTGDTTVFQPIDGTLQNIGSVSPWGPCSINNDVYFVGGSDGALAAYVLDGFTPRRISTPAVEERWNQLTGIGSCISYGYQEEGHSFWVIYFGISGQTWCFDTSTGAWHERKRWAGGTFIPADTCYHAFVEWPNGTRQHLTGGPTNGKIYNTSVNLYTDDGADIAWQRALPYQYNEGKRLFFGRLTIDMETGTVAGGQPEPVISLDYSDDRGETFSNPRTAGIGTSGQKRKRVYWKSNGASHERVFRLSGVGKSKVALVAADLEVDPGSV